MRRIPSAWLLTGQSRRCPLFQTLVRHEAEANLCGEQGETGTDDSVTLTRADMASSTREDDVLMLLVLIRPAAALAELRYQQRLSAYRQHADG
jgi:hypothetical protein